MFSAQTAGFRVWTAGVLLGLRLSQQSPSSNALLCSFCEQVEKQHLEATIFPFFLHNFYQIFCWIFCLDVVSKSQRLLSTANP